MNTSNATQVDVNTHKGRAFQRSGWDHWESQITVLSGVNEALITNNVTLRTEIINCENDSAGVSVGVVMSSSFVSAHSQLC